MSRVEGHKGVRGGGTYSAPPAGRSQGSPRRRGDVQPNENRVLSKLLRKKYSNNIGKLEYDLHKHRVDAPKYSYQALK